MANVSQERRSPLNEFFKGIGALQQGAETLVNYNMLNKRLEMERAEADRRYEIEKINTNRESLKSQTYAQQVLNAQGTYNPQVEYLKRAGIEPETFIPISKEARQLQKNIATKAAQHKYKLEEIDADARWNMVLESLKAGNATELQILKAKQAFTEKYITTAEAAAGVAAGEELKTSSKDVIQPVEELLSVPGLFGNKQVTARDVVNKVGTPWLRAVDKTLVDDKTGKVLGITRLEYIKKTNKALKETKELSERNRILNRLKEMYPEIADLLK